MISACHHEPTAPQDARVLITEPAAEAEIPAGDVTVAAFVERFDLVDRIGQDNAAGEGHIVYYMDVAPPLEQGQEALTEEGTYVVSTAASHTWTDVAPGRHTFWVQLVNNDNTPLEPPAAVAVEVQAVEYVSPGKAGGFRL